MVATVPRTLAGSSSHSRTAAVISWEIAFSKSTVWGGGSNGTSYSIREFFEKRVF